MNRIAVIFRGHVRTWHLLCDHMLPIYDSLATNVDYYFVTWQMPNFGTQDIINSFGDRNLVKILTVPILKDYYNSWLGSSWLSYNMLPYKRQREKHVTYDAIIDTRPDVAVDILQHKILPIEENTLYTTGLEIHHNWLTNHNDIAIQDWFLMCSSKVYNIMAERFTYNGEPGSQIAYRLFAEQEGINVCYLDYVKAFITRPNIGYDAFKNNKFGYVRHISDQWINLPKEEKLEIVKKYMIREDNYDTNCVHAKI